MNDKQEIDLEGAARLFQQGRFDEARKLLSSILETNPKQDTALALLAGVAHASGQFEEATTLINQAIEINPSVPVYHDNLGNLHKSLNNLGEALTCFEKVITLQPDNLHALLQLADCYEQTNKPEEALNHYKRALTLNPAIAEIHYTLGRLYLGTKDFKAATTSFRSACTLKPMYGEAISGLGDALRLTGYFDEAIDCYERALPIHGQVNPAFIHSNIGTCKQYLGNIEGAIASFKNAMSLMPDNYVLHTNLLMALNYSSKHSPEEVFQEHRSFGINHENQNTCNIAAYTNDRDPNRILKIGYVSSNFYDHSVAHFIKPVIENHDHTRFQVYGYYNNTRNDTVTAQFRSMIPNWRTVTDLSDDDLASTIHDDDIDILVDLNGHTADNRLLVFARKPAPIQVSWIGYPNTTGLTSMDYKITDAFADPPGNSDHLHTERLIRLADTFSCFSPPDPCPEVLAPPVLENGHITFGSFNNYAKITPQVLEVWCKLLNRCPGSHLLLKDQLFQDEKVRNRIKATFHISGIANNRIELLAKDASKFTHLQRYANVDIALDPFPYNGTTTTCEALWMGVPVITLTGTVHAGRVSSSQIQAIGLNEFVAQTFDQYIEIAAEFSHKVEYLQQLRSTMRERMAASSLMNADVFTRKLEAAYREIWHKRCSSENCI